MSAPPVLRVVRGEPTPEDLAAVAAVVGAVSGSLEPSGERPARGRWKDPAAAHRRPWLPGPGAWRASAR
ncbi:MAG: acyl-CoA carboxylase epsilon subunit [Jatrophihabitantaceae bacterium]